MKEKTMDSFYVKIGDRVTFSKTISEYDVYGFAGITGDFSSNHVNEEVMKRSSYGQRIAHGALMVGFFSTCSTKMIEACDGIAKGETAVSAGYDKVRFLAGVLFGDTIEFTYEIIEIDTIRRRSVAKIEAKNQHGELVAVAQHILRWVRNP
jgi:3-hydroxybutyryl-CoA dehydratase